MNALSAFLCLLAALILAVAVALHGGRYQFQFTGGAVIRMERWTGVVEIGSSEGWRVMGE